MPTSALDDIAQILNANAAGRGSGRFQQSVAQQGQDRNAISLYGAQQDAAKLGLKAPGYLAGETARGDLLANLQPVSFSGLPDHIHVPTITGGATPAALGPNARAAGANLSSQSLSKLQAGPSSYMPTSPSLTPLPTSGAWDTAAEAGGLGAGLLSALMKGAGSGSGSGGDIGKLLSAIFGRGGSGGQGDKPYPGGALPGGNDTPFTGWDPSMSDPGGNPYLPSDPGFYVGGGQPSDPSGGTGVGPGMQEYYDWLARQQQGNNGGPDDTTQWTGDGWGDF